MGEFASTWFIQAGFEPATSGFQRITSTALRSTNRSGSLRYTSGLSYQIILLQIVIYVFVCLFTLLSVYLLIITFQQRDFQIELISLAHS